MTECTCVKDFGHLPVACPNLNVCKRELASKPGSVTYVRDPLLVEREKTHGRFAENAMVWVELNRVIPSNFVAGLETDNPRQALALQMILLKLARLVTGPIAGHKDHWNDIAGYAKLGSEACE